MQTNGACSCYLATWQAQNTTKDDTPHTTQTYCTHAHSVRPCHKGDADQPKLGTGQASKSTLSSTLMSHAVISNRSNNHTMKPTGQSHPLQLHTDIRWTPTTDHKSVPYWDPCCILSPARSCCFKAPRLFHYPSARLRLVDPTDCLCYVVSSWCIAA